MDGRHYELLAYYQAKGVGVYVVDDDLSNLQWYIPKPVHNEVFFIDSKARGDIIQVQGMFLFFCEPSKEVRDWLKHL